MKVLIIEDDARIAVPVKEELEHQAFEVQIAATGSEGLHLALSDKFDIILLDLMLPEIDGLRLCQTLREKGSLSSILMLTSRAGKAEKILGLDSGADDYMTKPFDIDELSARVRVLARRRSTKGDGVITCGALLANTSTCTVMYSDKLLNLTPFEYRLLVCLLRHPGTAFSRQSLVQRLWLDENTPYEEAVNTHVKTLRKKLAQVGAPKNLIETVHGVGYRLNVKR